VACDRGGSFFLLQLHPSGRLEQMDGSTRNILEVLPNELIANILAMLHYQDLASTIQVHLLSFKFLSHFYD
jgi:hypothetical protein